jgi:hypothetical protein
MLISGSTSVSAEGGGASHAVFVETNGTRGNAILAYHRADDGTLTRVASYPTFC